MNVSSIADTKISSGRRSSRKRSLSISLLYLTFALVAAVLLSTNSVVHAEGDAPTKCNTEKDLDSENCNLEDLPNSELESICQRIGLDLEMHVFPYLFEEEEEEINESPVATTHTKHERTHDDYVLAAKECLSIEVETERMMEEDPEAMAELERSMLEEDPALLAEIVADVLAKSPDLVEELEMELEKEDPELFRELMSELGEGQTLADRPEILAELVAMMLAEDPDMLDKLDEDVAAHMLENEQEGDGAGVGEL